jgi:hypothetical protein
VNLRNLAVALSAGVVAFLVVAVAVTEILSSRIWPSAVVGLPAGILAGVVGRSRRTIS